MYITSLELSNFRNYQQLHLKFEDGINLFYGDNAQGKTNILESVFVCGTTKSHKGSKDKDMIRIGKEEAHIRMRISKDGIIHQIDMHLKKNKAKGIAIDGIPIKRSGELFGFLPVIFFSPEDLSVIKNGPSERRRFMDIELCQMDKVYFYHLAQYNHVLQQRNQLLKQLGQKKDGLFDTVDSWDQLLVQHGKILIEIRKQFVKDLNGLFQETHKKLTGGQERVFISYAPAVDSQDLKQKLKENLERDIILRSTSAGPHRDDIIFWEGDKDLRKFGSQGQQRTAALSLKLSEISLMKGKVNSNPVLLLDDVFSELDRSRQQFLLESLKGVQTLITCTGLEEFVRQQMNARKTFHVVHGVVQEE